MSTAINRVRFTGSEVPNRFIALQEQQHDLFTQQIHNYLF